MMIKTRFLHPLLLAGSLFLAIVLALRLVVPAQAVEFSNDSHIPADEVIDDDLFISTGDLVMDGTVNGDLFVNSSKATINGVVNGNLIVNSAKLTLNGQVNGSLVFAGQSAIIAGQVSGSIYSAGATVVLTPEGEVGRNVFFAGFSLDSQAGSLVKRDLSATGYQTLVNGQIGRNLNFAGASLVIGGQIGGDVNASVSSPEEQGGPLLDIPFFRETGTPPLPGGIQVQPEAQIAGKLHYISPVEQAGAILSQPVGGISFTQKVDDADTVQTSLQAQAALWVLGALRELGALLILGALAVWLTPGSLRRSVEQLRSRPLPAFGWGLLSLPAGFLALFLAVLLVLAVGILISVVSLGGLSRAVFGIGFSSISLALSVFLLLLAYGSKLVAALAGGEWLFERFAASQAGSRFWPLAVGILVYFLLRLIPVIGPLAGIAATLGGMGAIWLALRAARRPAAPEAAVEPPDSPAG